MLTEGGKQQQGVALTDGGHEGHVGVLRDVAAVAVWGLLWYPRGLANCLRVLQSCFRKRMSGAEWSEWKEEQRLEKLRGREDVISSGEQG